MVAALVVAALAVQVQVTRDTAKQKTDVNLQVRIGATEGDSARRIPVTAEHLATAFRDAGARALLAGARAARLSQDSALRSYDAKAFQRISAGLSLRENGADRLMIRDEGVARIQWDRRAGAIVDMLGKRTTVPFDDHPEQTIGEGERSSLALPIPYFPGRETLWMGSSVAQTSIDESNFVHPLAAGAEAYYRYATGDSMEFSLPDGKRILLRELRVEARAPHWNVIVGSFWFDQATSQLVRAVYRPSIDLDVWEVATDEAKRDSTNKGDDVPSWVRALVSPLKASMHVFTVEYSLFEGRFWLPVSQGAEGKAQASFIRVPVTFEERYEYASVNGPVGVMKAMETAPPAPPLFESKKLRDSLANAGVARHASDSIVAHRRQAFIDSLPRTVRQRAVRDSLRKAGLTPARIDSMTSERARVVADSLRRRCEASPDSQVVRHIRRYQSSVDVLVRTPCDLQSLRHSPELPASAYDPGEEVYGTRQRDELLKALDFGLQAGWGPQRPVVDWGISQSRYNRVEGFSTGIALKQDVGLGLSWSAKLRGSTGDRRFNGELGVSRSNGRTTLGLNAYRRLVSANDWGSPLTFSGSLPGLLYGDDEGFYYRAWGGEFTGAWDRSGQLTWRLFAEEESNAPVTTRFSLFGGAHDKRFIANVASTTGTYTGAALRWQQHWGLAPRGWRTSTDVRVEGAHGSGGGTDYGRTAFDVTVSHALFGSFSSALTTAAGSSLGEAPPQRGWFLGGVQTIRGQDAGAATGDAFWFSRLELARGGSGTRTSVFGDLGWAGSRRAGDWGKTNPLLSGVGVGWSFLDGLIRFDVSRGLRPKQQWNVDFSLNARF